MSIKAKIGDLREYYMRCYLKFHDKLLVPESTCQIIFSSFFNMLNLHNNDIITQIRTYANTFNSDKNIAEMNIHIN